MDAQTEQGPQQPGEEETSWRLCKDKIPRSEIVYFIQVLVIYTVVIASIYNLSIGHEDGRLWTALLSSSIGILVPNPSMTTGVSERKKDVLPDTPK